MRYLGILLMLTLFAKGQTEKEFFTMFYNVENLFDTINDPMKNDNEFLPFSKKKWDSEKYNQKISQLSKVFAAINNGEQPNIIGLSEVENKRVIQDLLNNPFFDKNNYTIIHNNSPDRRGIDCALLFDNNFKLLNKEFIPIHIPNSKKPTRDIVYAKLQIGQQIINIFVNHWPSRWGGQKETNHKRVFSATVLRNYINQNIDTNEYVIIMGDLNDYSSNESVKHLIQDNFINLMESISGPEKGSYNYKGNWNFIDHIIISKNFFQEESKLAIKNYDVFKKNWLLYTNEEGVQYPSRTYGGNNWYGGFSDHLAIFCNFKIKSP